MILRSIQNEAYITGDDALLLLFLQLPDGQRQTQRFTAGSEITGASATHLFYRINGGLLPVRPGIAGHGMSQ